jgi:hypothetical protein
MKKKQPVSKDLAPSASVDASTIAYLRASLVQLEQAVVDATEAGSWTAVSNLKKAALEVRRTLDTETAKASSPDDSMSDEQLIGVIVDAVASLPPQHLERIEDAISLRRTGKVVRLAQA